MIRVIRKRPGCLPAESWEALLSSFGGDAI